MSGWEKLRWENAFTLLQKSIVEEYVYIYAIGSVQHMMAYRRQQLLNEQINGESIWNTKRFEHKANIVWPELSSLESDHDYIARDDESDKLAAMFAIFYAPSWSSKRNAQRRCNGQGYTKIPGFTSYHIIQDASRTCFPGPYELYIYTYIYIWCMMF